MNVALIPNFSKNNAHEAACEVVNVLINSGHFVYSTEEICKDLEKVIAEKTENLSKICDIFIAIGGDGTIINTAKIANGKKILGVNMGRLGYLANFEREEIPKIPEIISSECHCEERMMIDISVSNKFVGSALNEGVISAPLSKLLDFEVSVNTSAYTYRADGLIISTPTGSTAYTLSAGGPVIDPVMKSIIYTLICPHSLFNRSMVFSENTMIDVKVMPKKGEKVLLTIDGRNPIEIKEGNLINFKKSDKTVKLIIHKEKNFFNQINNKFFNT